MSTKSDLQRKENLKLVINVTPAVIFKNHPGTDDNTSDAFFQICVYHGNGYPHVKGQLQCRVALVQTQVQII